ncbi:MAG: carbon monoxide dehydrogenase subunit G [Alphaproteobacteria bacterium]
MDISGEVRIPASRQRVWDALNDPEILRQSVPGCEELEKISDTEFTAKVKLKLGPVKAAFSGKVTLDDLDEPNGYTLRGEGQGGVAGFANGKAMVKLTDDGDGTLLSYQSHAAVGGKLAQVGQRVIQAASDKLTAEFFTRFSEVVAGTPGQEPSRQVDSPAETPESPATTAPGLAPWAWGGAVLTFVVALLWYFGRS